MKRTPRVLACLIGSLLFGGFLVSPSTIANASRPINDEIDIRALQKCLQTDDASLDVLVLMDSSRSLRPNKVDPIGSDPEQLRGPVLKSSLKLLRTLAEDSDSGFRINLRNFGDNDNPAELALLKENWIPWTTETDDRGLDNFVKKALFDDSTNTNWARGVESARVEFTKIFAEALESNSESCSVMFWITDGAPEPNPADQIRKICSSGNLSSLDWFRENNILVLGGLLRPKAGSGSDASRFAPMVLGQDCGRSEDAWTRGSVIEADDISSLAWEFVSLIANIKSLVNLNATDDSFNLDPGTSHLEVFVRGMPANWQLLDPAGNEFCSSQNLTNQCEVVKDSDVGITTIIVYPAEPVNAAGKWQLIGTGADLSIKAYGGLSTNSPKSKDLQLRINPDSISGIDEGKEVKFKAQILNADGSVFNAASFSSVEICAEISSVKVPKCEPGKSTADFGISPNLSDTYVNFQATLTSKFEDRSYLISAAAKVSVVESSVFPSLNCIAKNCRLNNVPNKNTPSVNLLSVIEAETGNTAGSIYLKSYRVASDQIEERSGRFAFKLSANGSPISWGDKTALLNPGDEIKMDVSTEIGGESEVKAIIEYVVLAEGKEVVRQIEVTFEVRNDQNRLIQALLMLLAYLITLGIPYLYLLWSARRAAVISVPDGELRYLIAPVKISEQGKLTSVDDGAQASWQTPSHETLIKLEVPTGATRLQIGPAVVTVVPPKWNPFTNPQTKIVVPEHHLLSTAAGLEFNANSASYTPHLVGDAILYFETESNLSPVVHSSIGSSVSSSVIFDAENSLETRDALQPRTGEISAMALLIISPWGNRRKSLADLAAKLKSGAESANLNQLISDLRAAALKTEVERKSARLDKPVSPIQEQGSGNEASDESSIWEGFDSTSSGNSSPSKSLWHDENNGDDQPGSTRNLWN